MKRFAGGAAPTGPLAEALVAAMTDTILLVDAMGRIAFLATDGDDVLGEDVDRWIGQSALDLVHPEDLGKVVSRLQAAASDADAKQQFIRVRIGNTGGWFPVELHGFNPLELEGTPLVLVSIRDTTGQLSIDQARRFADRSLAADGPTPDPSTADGMLATALQYFRSDKQVLFLHVCLSNYEAISTQHGVAVASGLLTAAADSIISHSRGNDLVTRIDQGALLVVCLDVEATDANDLAERVFHLCKQTQASAPNGIDLAFQLGFALASEGDDLAAVRAFAADAAQFS